MIPRSSRGRRRAVRASTAGFARERGINTVVVGHPMGFWRDNMPGGVPALGPVNMDAAGTHTLAAFLQQRDST
jgi:hypothetical protein